MLAREGARVVIGDIQEIAGQDTATAIREAGGEAIFQKVDVMEEKDCTALIEMAVRSYGRLDVLVNNAGWYPRTPTHMIGYTY